MKRHRHRPRLKVVYITILINPSLTNDTAQRKATTKSAEYAGTIASLVLRTISVLARWAAELRLSSMTLVVASFMSPSFPLDSGCNLQ